MKQSPSQVIHLTSDVKFAAIYARVSTEDQGKGFSYLLNRRAVRGM